MKNRIADYMTKQPWSVQIDDSPGVARQMIAEREIKHLPVLDGKDAVGMVTEHELALVADRIGATVGDVMAPVHRADTDDLLEDVLDRMLEHRWDAVVLSHNGSVDGIFTATDAVRLLRQMLRRRAA